MPDLRARLRARPYLTTLVLAVVLLVANLVALPDFASPGNWGASLRLLAPFALVAMASTPAIVSGGGGLDLSVGPLATVVNVVLIVELLPSAVGASWLAIPLLLVLGTAVGLVNGLLVAVLRFQPVIATLCTFFVLGGVALRLAPQPAPTSGNWTGELGRMPWPLVLIAVPAVIWLLLGRTPFLRSLYAVGANDAAAFSAGVPVTAVRVLAYGLGGLFAAVGGIALTAFVQTADATLAVQYTLVGIAAVVLGGTPIGGGRGGLLGSLLGAITIFLLQNLLSSAHVPAVWLQVVYGLLLLGGVLLSARLVAARPARSAA